MGTIVMPRKRKNERQPAISRGAAAPQRADAATVLPDGWFVRRLKDVWRINPPQPSSDAVPASEPVTYVPMVAVDAISGTITEPQLRTFSEVRKGSTSFAEGDVIQESFRRDAAENMTGSVGQKRVPAQYMADIEFPLPPLAEQREIVRRIDALFALADKSEARVQAATARVEKITKTILAKAFRGELVPTDAELARA